MTDLEKRAFEVMHQAFCRLRYFSTRPLNKDGQRHLFLVADASHNIPDALAGNAFHRENLERDVQALEELLAEPYSVALSRYAQRDDQAVSSFQRLRAALGF